MTLNAGRDKAGDSFVRAISKARQGRAVAFEITAGVEAWFIKVGGQRQWPGWPPRYLLKGRPPAEASTSELVTTYPRVGYGEQEGGEIVGCSLWSL